MTSLHQTSNTTYHRLLAYLLACSICQFAIAQNNHPQPTAITLLSVDLALQLPQGDLAQRFGNNANVGAGLFRKTASNWCYGFDTDFLFGNQIVEDSLVSNIATANGYLLTQSGTYADMRFYERGIGLMAKFGKLFPIKPQNPNSGIVALFGLVFFQHKIAIIDKENSVKQLQGDYLKGYDRLSNGPAISCYLGYLHLPNNRLINFSAGLEMMYARTKNRRSYNFDTQTSDTNNRNDLLLGARLYWFVPIYKKNSQTKYYTN